MSEIPDHEHDRGRGRGAALLGAIIYIAASMVVSYYTMHPEEARELLHRWAGRPPMPAHLARRERIVADFRRELAAWNHGHGQAEEADLCSL